MADNDTLVAVSAFSGLAGALLSQVLSGLFAYYTDKRKTAQTLKTLYRNKKIEIAENYYYVTGETMGTLKKSINYLVNYNDMRRPSTIAFLNEEIKKVDHHLSKLYAENWKQNLVGLYFDVSLSNDAIIELNTRSHDLHLKRMDIADKIKDSASQDTDELYGKYSLITFDLCAQYQKLYDMLSQDRQLIKDALSVSFKA